MRENIAIVGEFASGKTTLAEYLIENYRYTRLSFAKRLKEVAEQVYHPVFRTGIGGVEKTGRYEVWPLDETNPVDVSGREILQRLGQSVKELDKLFWVRWMLNDMEAGRSGTGPFVIDDCRFPYEADALRERGFIVARLVTPLDVRMNRYELSYGRRPTPAEMNHPSETEVQNIKWDALLDGTKPVEILAEALVESVAAA